MMASQNATVERHGGTIKRMIYKCMQDTTMTLQAIVASCCQAKNNSAQHHGHSPQEWATGRRHREACDLLQEETPLAALSLVENSDKYAEKIKTQMNAKLSFEKERAREVLTLMARILAFTPDEERKVGLRPV